MRERAALRVLTRESDRDPVLEQRREGERLRLAPVDAALLHRVVPTLQLAGELRVDREPGWHAEELLVQRPQAVSGHGGDHGVAGGWAARRLPRRRRHRWRFGDRRPEALVRLTERLGGRRLHRLYLVLGEHTLLHELLRILLANGRLRLDPRDLERLRVRRLVLLVVPEAPVADEVDDDVVAELLPEGEREPDRRDRSLRVVGVDVDDRNVEPLGEVAAVARRAALERVRREADLVVPDQVEGAARRVAVEALEVERLGNDPLAGERGVAVDEERQGDGRVVEPRAARPVRLLGTGPALDDGVDGLQVARVGDQRDVDLARTRRAGAGGGEVVLHVPGPAFRIDDEGVVRPLSLELAEDRLVRAPDGVGQGVEPTAVGHPDHHLVGTRCRDRLDRLVDHDDEHVEPLERELLLPEERPAEVLLEALDLREPREQRSALLGRERPTESP